MPAVVQHTPGPWTFGIDNTLDFAVYGKGSLLATVYENADTRLAKANARLITAAPELLKALKQALVVMESVAETHGYDTEVGAVPAARAAIAEAEGL